MEDTTWELYFVIPIIGIVFLLIFRGVICWFWKLNEIVEILKDIRGMVGILQDIRGLLSHSGNPTIDSTKPEFSRFLIPWECPRCSNRNSGFVHQCYHCNYKRVNPSV